MKRRSLLLASLAVAVAAVIWKRPGDNGENHSPYFRDLGASLDRAGQSKPTLVIDKQRMLANVATLKAHVGERFDYRVVVKQGRVVGKKMVVTERCGVNVWMEELHE